MLSLDLRRYLAVHEDFRVLFDELRRLIIALEPTMEREFKRQVAYEGRRTFTRARAPGQYLGERGAPLVLSLALLDRKSDPRWKEIVELRRGAYGVRPDEWTC